MKLNLSSLSTTSKSRFREKIMQNLTMRFKASSFLGQLVAYEILNGYRKQFH